MNKRTNEREKKKNAEKEKNEKHYYIHDNKGRTRIVREKREDWVNE